MGQSQGRIACLGWGSLIWRNEGLSCDRKWREDGPEVSVEFARMSRRGEVTLVIVRATPSVPVLWSVMQVPTLADAIESLRVREGPTRREWIGAWSTGSDVADSRCDGIGAWAEAKGLSGVVWTALPAKWGDDERVPGLPEVLRYLSGLDLEKRLRARTYILNAPAQINTPYRAALTAWAEDGRN